MKTTQDKSARHLKSNFYEQLVEHAFISELLQEAWFRYGKAVEVLRSEIDSFGYDLLLECNGIIRHMEIKTSGTEAKRSFQNINMALAQKPSGCVVWLMRKEDESKNTINLKYLYFCGPLANHCPLSKPLKLQNIRRATLKVSKRKGH